MKKTQVRCWQVENFRKGANSPDKLYITYPEENNGHDLITCLTCGAIYAVNIAKEVYIGPPLNKRIQSLNCSNCGSPLQGNYANYPETYIVNGNRISFKRARVIPSEGDSIVKEFEEIYE